MSLLIKDPQSHLRITIMDAEITTNEFQDPKIHISVTMEPL